jgi:glucose-6-phosphate dehydrogenase assembly protein OpcA
MEAAMTGEDLRVDAASIEKSLAELWRVEKKDGEQAVTRAALWNVIAHTWTAEHHAHAAETLGRASASVPQRTINIHASPEGKAEINSWISANCHLVGRGKQVCSEEIAIVAAGDHVDHVPPLVSALLLPDMPVALWWLGDLPSERHRYVETLLDPADRLIVDSSQFDSVDDLALVTRIAETTTTAPADLSWARLDEWRVVTASLFDPPRMRERLGQVRSVKIVISRDETFGDRSEALLYVAWLSSQIGTDVSFDFVAGGGEGIGQIEISFDDSVARMVRDRERHVLVGTADGEERTIDCLTRLLGRGVEQLIVRQLKDPQSDRVYLRALKTALRLAA